jgi:hypothetical protein
MEHCDDMNPQLDDMMNDADRDGVATWDDCDDNDPTNMNICQ